jgi:hypothetical protein
LSVHAPFAATSAAFVFSSSVGGGNFAKTDVASKAAITDAAKRMAATLPLSVNTGARWIIER